MFLQNSGNILTANHFADEQGDKFFSLIRCFL